MLQDHLALAQGAWRSSVTAGKIFLPSFLSIVERSRKKRDNARWELCYCCSCTPTAGHAPWTQIYEVSAAQDELSTSYWSLDISISPVENKSLLSMSVFVLYPKTLQFIKMLTPAFNEPVQAKFFSCLGIMAWNQSAKRWVKQRGIHCAQDSSARIPYVSWDKSKQKLIVCACIDRLEQVLDSIRMNLGMTALRAHDCAIIRQLVRTHRPRMRAEKYQVERSATDNHMMWEGVRKDESSRQHSKGRERCTNIQVTSKAWKLEFQSFFFQTPEFISNASFLTLQINYSWFVFPGPHPRNVITETTTGRGSTVLPADCSSALWGRPWEPAAAHV